LSARAAAGRSIRSKRQATIREGIVFIANAKRVRNTRAQRRDATLGKAGIKMIADAFTFARLSDDLRGATKTARASLAARSSPPLDGRVPYNAESLIKFQVEQNILLNTTI
jgi:hypothetical protein